MRNPGKIRYSQGIYLLACYDESCDCMNYSSKYVSTLFPNTESYYMKLINIHDVEVSISAWVSHVIPLK